ncbi:MAG: hypothetical protein ACFCUN_12620 [Hyphomicrobiaceae bacterium]
MLYVDTPTNDDLTTLAATRADACVSIYVPTTPLTQDIGAARIALSNLIKTALGQLDNSGFDKRRRALLIDGLAALEDDDEFWRLQAHSLAVFATPDRVLTFRLANRLHELVQVSDRFHLKPLLRAVTFPHEAIVLALSENSVRAFQILSDAPPVPLRVSDLPKDAASHARKATLNSRGASGRIHGDEGQRVRHLQYLRAVDAALRPLLAGRSIPLIVAAVDPLAHLYPSVNTYKHMLPEGIRVSPDEMTDAALSQLAIPLLDHAYAKEIQAVQGVFERRSKEGRGSTDLTDVARAATFGAIDTLLVDIDDVVPGTVDDNGVISRADHESAATYGVVDEIAARALSSGARILAVRRQDVPGKTGVAAILRYSV